MTYLLDTMVVGFFQRAGRQADLAAAASVCPMAVVGEVRVELANGTEFGGGKFRNWFAGSGIQVLDLVVGSPAQITLGNLVGAIASVKNLGERASIALAASDSSLTFVTHDKGAMWLALREIWEPGERILGVSVFLRRLFEQGTIRDVAVLDEVIGQIAVAHRPTWWAEWRASVTAVRNR